MPGTITKLIKAEEQRQAITLMMIPSENYTYGEVRSSVGSVLMHKYAEGLPYKRYYQGNQVADQIEAFCIDQALAAYHLDPAEWMVNVQPHSGCEANLAALSAILEPGDRVLSMYLPDGGHLSHGWQLPEKKISLSSKIYNFEFYRVNQDSRVFDYDQIEKQAEKFRPKLIISGGTAYPRQIDYERIGQIAKKLGAYYLADVAHEAGLIAADANTSPFDFADIVTLTTHKTLRGPRGALIFARQVLGEKINAAVFPGLQGGPHLHTIAGIAIALEKTQTKQFKNYAFQTVKNAQTLARLLVGVGFDVVSGGTDKHLILIDMRPTGTAAWAVAKALEAANIIVNKNTVPFDDAKAFYPSGIRLGTPAVTVRGLKEKDMATIADWIVRVIKHLGPVEIPADKLTRQEFLKKLSAQIKADPFYRAIAKQVEALCRRHPIPD